MGDNVPTTYLDAAAPASPSESDMFLAGPHRRNVLCFSPNVPRTFRYLWGQMVYFADFGEFFDKSKEMFTASPKFVRSMLVFSSFTVAGPR
jgi:hypothetical protein